jgi:uncharacterized repeat protein (TIGR03803 family)
MPLLPIPARRFWQLYLDRLFPFLRKQRRPRRVGPPLRVWRENGALAVEQFLGLSLNHGARQVGSSRRRFVCRPGLEELEPRLSPDVSLSGHAQWVDPRGGAHPIPLAQVQILQDSPGGPTPILSVTTDVNGNYQAIIPSSSFPQGGSLSVFAQINTQMQFDAKTPIAKVQDDVGQVYSVPTPDAQVIDGQGTVMMPTADASQQAGNVNGAFSVASAIVEATTYVTSPQTQGGLGAGTISSIDVYLNSMKPAFATSNTLGVSAFVSGTGINILSGDLFHWDVIQHEYGHYVADTFGFDGSNPGTGSHVPGSHLYTNNNATAALEQAWNEGWADNFAVASRQAMLGQPYALGVPSEGAAAFEFGDSFARLDAPVHSADLGDPAGIDDEYSVASFLYQVTSSGLFTQQQVFSDLQNHGVQTFGQAYLALVGGMAPQQRMKMGQIAAGVNLAPGRLQAGGAVSLNPSDQPTFSWAVDSAPDGTNDFTLEFFDSNYRSIGQLPVTNPVKTEKTIGSTSYTFYNFTPSYQVWRSVVDTIPAGQKLSGIRWVVEGQDTLLLDPLGFTTPPGILPTPGPNQRFWSAGATLVSEDPALGQPGPTVVNASDPQSFDLAQAINAADSNSSAINIINLPGGTYRADNISIHPVDPGKTLIIAGQGPGVVIDAQGSGRVFEIDDGNVAFENLTITGGEATDGGPNGTAAGGGLLIDGGHVVLSHVTVSNNKAMGNGQKGQHGANGAPGEKDVNDGNGNDGAPGPNGSDAFGGGIYLAMGNLILKSTNIVQNHAIGGDGGTGGNGGSGWNNTNVPTNEGLTGTRGAPGRPNGSNAAYYGAPFSRIGALGSHPGYHGGNGTSGKQGKRGRKGDPGGKGGDGGDGGTGGNAEGGGLYVAGGTVTLKLSSVTANYAVGGSGGLGGNGKKGGNGGEGGRGGAGGPGGPGGRGGDGWIFYNYVSGFSVPASGGSGGNGGNGGRGGTGGAGGDGGPGGNGGRGGNGGKALGGGIYLSGGTLLLAQSPVGGSTVTGGPSGIVGQKADGGSGGGGGPGGTAGAAGALGYGGHNPFGEAFLGKPVYQPNGVPGGPGSPGEASTVVGLHGALGSDGPAGNVGMTGGDIDKDNGTEISPSGQAPQVHLVADNITGSNIPALDAAGQYTFSLVFQDPDLIDAATLAAATVQLEPPGAAPITAHLLRATPTAPVDALGDASQITATYGIASPTFSWADVPPGTYTVSLGGSPVTDLANNAAKTGQVGSFFVTADTLVVSKQPKKPVLGGAPFEVMVTAERNGQIDTSFNGSVTLALGANPGNARLGGTLTVPNATAGVADFTGLTLDQGALGYTLQASGLGQTVASAPIDVSAIAPKSLSFNKTDVTAGVDYSYTVTGAALPEDIPIALYWSPGSSFGSNTAVQVANSTSVAEDGTQPSPTPFARSLPSSVFHNPNPPGLTSDLLLVVGDPTQSYFDPTKDVIALTLPDLTADDVTWNTDPGELYNANINPADRDRINYTYTIQDAALPPQAVGRFYWTDMTDTQASSVTPEIWQQINAGTFTQWHVLGAASPPIGLGTALGQYDEKTPAAWGVPPAATTYILFVADPDNLLIESTNSNNFAVLKLHTAADLLKFAIARPVLVDSNGKPTSNGTGVGITANFVPGGDGLEPLSEAEVRFGVAEFNWIQTVQVPENWQPVTLKNLDYGAAFLPNDASNLTTQVVNGQTKVVYLDDFNNDGPIAQTSDGQLIIDPIVAPFPGAPVNAVTRAIIIDQGNHSVLVYPWENTAEDSGPLPYPDNYVYYLKEQDSKNWQGINNKDNVPSPFQVNFEDAPSQDIGAFGNSGQNYLAFTTTLVGVNYDLSSWTDLLATDPTTGNQFTIGFTWHSNTTTSGGGISDVHLFGSIAGPDPTATYEGGISDVQLTNQYPALPTFSGLSAPTITYGTSATKITGQLTLTNGHNLPAGETVYVTLNGTTQTATLDGRGNFTATLDTATPGVSGSPYPVSFYYPGDASYADMAGSSTLTVTKAKPTVSVSDANGTFNGQPFSATATVTGVTNTPSGNLDSVAPTLDYLRHNSDGSTTDLGPIAPSAAGTYTVTASFPGSTNYTAATSPPSTFTISRATPTLSVNPQTFPATPAVAGVVKGKDDTAGPCLEGVNATATNWATAGGTSLAGPPTGPGDYTAVVTFPGSADYAALTQTEHFTVTMYLSRAALPAGEAGVGYSQGITAGGGTGPYEFTFTITSATTPNQLGLTIDTSGQQLAITGTPSAAGTFTLSVTATDARGARATGNYSVMIYPALALAPADLPAGSVGTAYNQTIGVTGGTGSITLAVSPVQNPIPGLGLSVTGSSVTPATTAVKVDGTPTTVGTAGFTVTATDSLGGRAQLSYSVAVVAAGPPPQFSLDALASFAAGSDPNAGLVLDVNGNLFGTTRDGGVDSAGTVFELMRGASNVTTLDTFNNYTNGANPSGLIMDRQGNLWGTTLGEGQARWGDSGLSDGVLSQPGYGNYGTVFEVPAKGGWVNVKPGQPGSLGYDIETWKVTYGDITPMAYFHGFTPFHHETESPSPSGLVMDPYGNFWGTTQTGGKNGFDGSGSVFELPQGSGGTNPKTFVTTADSFSGSLSLGTNPVGGLAVDENGNLFGITPISVRNNTSTIFEFTQGHLVLLATLPQADTGNPGPLVLDGSGDLFGINGNTIFELKAGATSVITFNLGLFPVGGLTIDSRGNLFGTTENGGAHGLGMVFELARTGSGYSNSLTPLAYFDGTNTGSRPTGSLVLDSQGDLFGITQAGGHYNGGTIFEVRAGPPHLAFATAPQTGAAGTPIRLTVQVQDPFGNPSSAGGGLTVNLGSSSGGIFEDVDGNPITTVTIPFGNSSSATVLYNDVIPGSPTLTLSASGGVLPGTQQEKIQARPTAFTPALGGLAVASLSAGTSSWTSLAGPVYEEGAGNAFATSTGQTIILDAPAGFIFDYNNAAGVGLPSVAVTGLGGFGSDYAITYNQGQSSATRLVFTVTASSNQALDLLTWTNLRVEPTAATPLASGTITLDSNSTATLSGITPGSTFGTLVETPAYPINTLSAYGMAKQAPFLLVIDQNGNLFGATNYDGILNRSVVGAVAGTLFKVAAGTTTITTVANFLFGPDAPDVNYEPLGLTVDSRGDVFGGGGGGTFGDGMLYELPAGANSITTPVSFNRGTGYEPSHLYADSNGDVFGTTLGGGANSSGTIFEVPAGGNTILPLYSFSTQDGTSTGPLTVDSTGDIFGTTYHNGGNGQGEVYELARTANGYDHGITVLATFNGTNGAEPAGSLVRDSNADLFGVTYAGGAYGKGTVYELVKTASGYTIKSLASFNGTDGSNPEGLIADSTGDFFGATQNGGGNNQGTIFELPQGNANIVTLASFNPSNALVPDFVEPELVLDKNGDLLGVSDGGNGSIIELNPVAQPHLAFVGAPPNLTAGVAGSFTVQLQDAIGNPLNATTKLTVSLSSTSSGSFLQGNTSTASVTIPAGSSSVSVQYLDATAGSLTLTATASDPKITAGTQQETVQAGPAILTPADAVAIASNSANTSWTTLSGPTYEEGAEHDLASMPGQTIVLDAPTGFVFDYNGAGGNLPSVAVSAVGGPGTTDYTVSYDQADSNARRLVFVVNTLSAETIDRLSWSNLRVEPTTATPLASGTITLDGNSTATPAGVTAGSTNFGTLTEVDGYALAAVSAFDANAPAPVGNLTLDASTGDFFGTTHAGGLNGGGTIFEVVPGPNNTFNVTTRAFFDAVIPAGGLVLLGGNLFGTTVNPVTNGGTIFELAAGSTSITTLATFTGAVPNGGLVVDGNGDLFGTTANGGDQAGDGTIFELKHTANGYSPTITTLAFFNSSTGQHPLGDLLIDPNSGALLGTTASNGPNNPGTLFMESQGNVTTLATFSGASPTGGLLMDGQGNLLGTTADGGDSNGDGTVFELQKIGSGYSPTLSTVATFNGTNGRNPLAQLILDSNTGNLFGTTSQDGLNGSGTVFQVTLATGVVTSLGSFSGAAPSGGIVRYKGTVFGTTSEGGANGAGTVYEVDDIMTVASFAGGTNPAGGVLVDGSGNLFCTASQGGAQGDGTVFEVPAGSTTMITLASFNGANGVFPVGSLVMDPAGDLFGTTRQGGTEGAGTIFEVAAGSHSITTLASLNGVSPTGGLVLDSQGDLFGTTAQGGANGDGAIFELAAGQHAVTILASFDGSNGFEPQADLAIDGSGNLFGTTWGGDSGTPGTVFELAAGGKIITTLATFDGTNGAFPEAGVILDGSGNLFGTTSQGGANGDGTVFELVHGSHQVTTLASFSGSNGAVPAAPLVLDSHGNLCGTTTAGGANGQGTMFELPAGASSLLTLSSFASNATLALNPSGLALDRSENLFGTTQFGGPNDEGTVYKVPAVGVARRLAFAPSAPLQAGIPGTLSVQLQDQFGNPLAATTSLTVNLGSNSGGLFLSGGSVVTSVTIAAGSSSATFQYNDTTAGTATLTASAAGMDTATEEVQVAHGTTGLIPASGGIGIASYSAGTSVWTSLNSPVYQEGTGQDLATTVGQTVVLDAPSGFVFDAHGAGGALPGVTATQNGGAGAANYTLTYDEADSSGSRLVFVVTAVSVQTIDQLTWSNLRVQPSSITPLAAGPITLDAGSTAPLNGVTPGGGVGDLSEVSAYPVRTLVSFNGSNGSLAYAGLTRDSQGDLFGTTAAGGANGKGSVFELPAGGTGVVTLASFDGSNGATPYGGLVRDAVGNLFGTTSSGGANGDGTVFEVAAESNTITTLASFDGSNGAFPEAGVILDGNGNLLGTTSSGGANGDGTVFEVAAGSNTITTLASFDGSNGADPVGGLVLDGNGDLFGTTLEGGDNSQGTVFEVAAGSNTITTLASFDGSNGAFPEAGVILDGNGNLLGTTSSVGANGDGTVFEVAARSNTITTLASFDGSNGADPVGGLVVDPRGNLFGTTSGGGANGPGTVFELPAGSGSITTLASFDGSNGADPAAGLVADATGDLFGTTLSGGADSQGTVFEVGPIGDAPAVTSAASATFTIGQPGSFIITASGFPTPNLGLSGTLPAGLTFVDDGNGTATLSGTPALGTGGVFNVLIQAGNGVLHGDTQTFSLAVVQAMPAVHVSDAGGTYDGNPFPASASVAGVVPGVDTTPAAALEGVTPTLTYYPGSYASVAALETALAGGLTGSNTAPTQAGSYTVLASFPGSTDYSSGQAVAPFTIAKATLTVTAGNASRDYDAANPAFTYTITGFASSDTAAVVSGSPTLTTPATAASAPGPYPIDADVSQMSAANYTVQPADGILTVSPAPLTASGAPVSATAGAPFSGVVATFTTPDLIDGAASFTATITWGDGSTSAGVVSGSNGGFTVSGSHTYAAAASYAVSVHMSNPNAQPATVNDTATVTSLGTLPMPVLVQMVIDVVSLPDWSNAQAFAMLETLSWMAYSAASALSPQLCSDLIWAEMGLTWDLLLVGDQPLLLVNNPHSIALANAIDQNPLYHTLPGWVLANAEMERLLIV